MIGFVFVGLATAWISVSVDVIVESIRDEAGALRIFGRTLATTSSQLEIWTLVGLGMSIAALVAGGIATALRRRDEATIRAVLDEQPEEVASPDARMEARSELLMWRLTDLQQQVDELMTRRDRLLAENQADAERIKEQIRSTSSRESLRSLRDGLIVLPDQEPDAEDAPVPGATEPSSSS